MSKKKVVKVEPAKTVKLKQFPAKSYLALSDSGVQLEMSAFHVEYVRKAFTQYEKAQKILEKYFSESK